ncbi:MAG: 30S ribosomal protein S12 methylthiotransferase RimO [Spirochaetaceae bacterium]|nr:30S ribosomal protein S12 methylthiotransferase RimO [Spirochaetaceae bacterium]
MRYYLDPFGCVKNQVDAETMMAFLGHAGWEAAADSSEADLIIINSCGFIETAKRESINAVLEYRKAYPHKRILLAGCLAQRYAGELSEALTEADGFFGNEDLSGIARAAAAAMGAAGPAADPGTDAAVGNAAVGNAAVGKGNADGPGGTPLFPGDRPLLSLPGSAYVKIAEGCNNRCSFCAIPGIRGPLSSRTIPDVAAECRRLLERGIRELCLIGQDLGSYGRDLVPGLPGSGGKTGGGVTLPALLAALSALEGDFWVRCLYIHPDNFPPAVLDLCRRDSRLLPYFDIPFQHGSADTLRAMNRRGSAETYLSLIDTIRGALPDAVIRSTFLTGFPGETEKDFEALLEFQARAALDWAGVFTYSREEDTPAYSMKGRVPKKIALERKRIVEERQIPITQGRMDRFIGRTMEVLVEEPIRAALGEGEKAEAGAGDSLYLGRLFCQAPEVDGAAVISSSRVLQPGTFIRGKVFARAGFDLEVARINA